MLEYIINELDIIALTRDILEQNLKKGDLGAVLHCYRNTKTGTDVGFEVEFTNDLGETIAQLTLKPDDIQLRRNPPTYQA